MPSPKLLFVLSNDFGELANALYLLQGYDFNATLLLPERLFAINRDTLPVPARCFRSLEEAIAAIDAEEPAIAFLFSGYLYAINQIFDLAATATLVEYLRQRCCLVTSDPFLGVLTNPEPASISRLHPQQQALVTHFARVSELVRDVIHLYLVPSETFAKTPSISFFNDRIIRTAQTLAADRQRLEQGEAIAPQTARWLFILASEDYSNQATAYGSDRWLQLLREKLRQAMESGKQPILIAPQSCIDSLRAIGVPEGALLLSFCNYDLFGRLLLDAEYVFYWNLFSNSIIPRIANRLPLFFFDRGHLARAIQPLFELGLREYYTNMPLPFLDFRQPLDPTAIATAAAAQAETMEPVRTHFRSSPDPAAIVARLARNEISS